MVEALPESFWFVLFQNFNFKDGFSGMEKKNNKPPPGLVPVAKKLNNFEAEKNWDNFDLI